MRWRSLAKPPFGAAPTRRDGESARTRSGKGGLELGVAAAQRVVFGVGDLRRIQLVIGAVVAGDLGGQVRQLVGRLLQRHASAPSRSVGGGARGGRHGLAGQHAGDLLAPRAGVQRVDLGRRPAADARLRDPQMRRATGCDLRAEWVTTSTCTWSATRASRSPTAAAVAPPMPESTSSNTRVGTVLPLDSTTFSASISRDSSPPEAIFASGPGVLPRVGGDQEAHRVDPLRTPARLLQRAYGGDEAGACRAAAAAARPRPPDPAAPPPAARTALSRSAAST